MSTNVLSARDVNTSAPGNGGMQTEDGKDAKAGVKSMEYHRQVLQSKMSEGAKDKYVSPSDNIMSPTTAKLSAMRNKRFMNSKPQSLFAKTSSRNAANTGLGLDAPVGKSAAEKAEEKEEGKEEEKEELSEEKPEEALEEKLL